jgi:hypothetical protein
VRARQRPTTASGRGSERLYLRAEFIDRRRKPQ